MSSGTLSSSPGPSTLQQNNKRTLSANTGETDRLTKRSRMTSEEPSLSIGESDSNSTTKDRKKHHGKEKSKISAVDLDDLLARLRSAHRRISRDLVKLGESSRSRSKSPALVNEKRDVEGAVLYSPKVGFASKRIFFICWTDDFARTRAKAKKYIHPNQTN
jgi:hypothetical protein